MTDVKSINLGAIYETVDIFVYMTQDISSLSHDVRDILSDYSNTFHISAESVKEQKIVNPHLQIDDCIV